MKECIFKIEGSKYYNNVFHEFNSIVSLDSDKSISLEHFGGKRRNLFRHKESNTSEEFFVSNYGNQMVSIRKESVMLVVDKDENKISIKLFNNSWSRAVGCCWFKKSTKVTFLSVNLRTGDVYSGSMTNYHKKRKFSKNIRRNYFWGNPLREIMSLGKNLLNIYFPENSGAIINDAVNSLINFLEDGKNTQGLSINDRLLKFYLDKRKIKYPNNFSIFYMQPITELTKELKKNNWKLVDAYMSQHGIHGKKVKKILHLCNNLNISNYKTLRDFFGKDWMNQNEDMILASFNFEEYTLHIPSELKDTMSEEEKKRLFLLAKRVILYKDIDVWSFNDHLRMYTDLKYYGEEIKLSSGINPKDFREEHLDWTDKIQHYRKGFYRRVYPNFFYEVFDKPIDDYYPVLLYTSTNYNEESLTQSNCVKSYIGKASSIIISLRKNSFDSEIRATIEYKLQRKNDRVEAIRVQTLGKFNSKLDESWNSVLLKLDKILLSSVQDKRFETVKISKKCLNGFEINSDSTWNEEGFLKWSFDKKNNDTIYYDFYD